jgi:hypothetical protein
MQMDKNIDCKTLSGIDRPLNAIQCSEDDLSTNSQSDLSNTEDIPQGPSSSPVMMKRAGAVSSASTTTTSSGSSGRESR